MDTQDFRNAVIVSADLEGFSAMLRSNETSAREAHSRFMDILKSSMAASSGRFLRSSGASCLLEFRTTPEAVAFAIRVQNAALNPSAASSSLPIRIGIQEGEVHMFEGEVFGSAVAAADALRTGCAQGKICISGEVHRQVGSKIDLKMKSLGMKNVEGTDIKTQAFEISLISDDSGDASDGEARQPRTGDTGSSGGRETEYAVDLRELKDLVLKTIKTAGSHVNRDESGRPRHAPPHDMDRLKEEWKDVAHEFRHEWKQQIHEIRRRRRGGTDDPVADYRRLVADKAEKARGGFMGHAIPYASVNGFLFFIWAMTGAGHPWFYYPLGGWGIGLATHFNGVKRQIEENNALEAYPELNLQEMNLFQKFFGARTAFTSHLVSNAAVSIYLLGINLITSPEFLWALIPAAAMSIGVFSHWSAYVVKKNKILKQLRELGSTAAEYLSKGLFRRKVKNAVRMRDEDRLRNPENNALLIESLRLRNGILAQLKRFGKDSPLGAEDEKTLDKYIEQIRTLGVKYDELSALIDGMPMADLEQDLVNLRHRLENPQTDTLKKEFEKSIQEIERQKKSYDDLKDHKEVLNLRFRSAVNNLKQMQIDLARMQGMSATGENATINSLKDRSKELSEYLDDFSDSYDELE